MLRKIGMWVVAVGILAGSAGVAKADDVTELRKQMEQQYEQMRQMQNKLIELEAAQKQQGTAVKKLEDSGPALPESLAWIEKVNLYGDFRYRYEYIDAEGSSSDQHRNRIRARIGLKGKVNDEMSYDFRIASGSEDPVSTNQTLDGGFSSKDIWLDRAYLQWEPASMDGWTFLFGKMGNPFFKAGDNQLIWDDDLNPEGIAAQYAAQLNDTTGLFINGGGMWIEESSSNADASLWGLQAGLEHALNDDSKLTWGGSYYTYGNVKDEKTFYDVEDGFGNTTYTDSDGDEVYMFDYGLAELFAEYGTKLGKTPASFYGNYVLNTASGVSEDTGWLVGTTFGKANDLGTWDVGYEYRDLEADAVIGVFTDSDFIGGGTGGKGHKFSTAYAIAKNATLGATYFMSQRDSDGDGSINDDYDRFQFDLKVKF
jgi:hypothetical protein